MKKINKKGFTLIELLAVIVIMGILMIVAIPAIYKYIENSKKDTFINTAKQYVHSVETVYNANDLICQRLNRYELYEVDADTIDNGTLYVNFFGSSWDANMENFGQPVKNAEKLMDSKVKSPWNNEVAGCVLITINNGKPTYSIVLTDGTYELKDSSGTFYTNYAKNVNSISRNDIKKTTYDNRKTGYIRTKWDFASDPSKYICIVKD